MICLSVLLILSVILLVVFFCFSFADYFEDMQSWDDELEKLFKNGGDIDG